MSGSALRGPGAARLALLRASSAALCASSAMAFTVVGPDPTIDVATIATCAAPKGGGSFKRYQNCKSSAYYLRDPIAATDASFKATFDAWNATQPDGDRWTLATGASPDWELQVATFQALAEYFVGGMEFQVLIKADVPIASYFWSQGLRINYKPGPLAPTVPPFSTMDTAAFSNLTCGGTVFCDPLYPFQYVDRRFYDRPMGPWPDSLFNAWAMVSQADYTTRTLTVFGGVAWGFGLSAEPIPEPATWVLLLSGFGLVGAAVRRRGRTADEPATG